jgi:tRNA(Ile2) C34 agmatinyltransferase TiaS
MSKILRNAARCKKCGETIESKSRHDFVTCKCGAISVDGGREYLRRVGNIEDMEDLSEVADETRN